MHVRVARMRWKLCQHVKEHCRVVVFNFRQCKGKNIQKSAKK